MVSIQPTISSQRHMSMQLALINSRRYLPSYSSMVTCQPCNGKLSMLADAVSYLLMTNLVQTPQPTQGEGEASRQAESALCLNLKRLKPEDELRRIFGSKFISSEGHDTSEGKGQQYSCGCQFINHCCLPNSTRYSCGSIFR